MQELNTDNIIEKATIQDIEAFLHGNDPEKYIVALEYGWRSSKIYKIKDKIYTNRRSSIKRLIT